MSVGKGIAIAAMWLATAAAVCAALWITKDLNCLWGFAAPTFATYHLA